MNAIEKIKEQLKNGKTLSELFDYVKEGLTIENLEQMKVEEPVQVSKASEANLGCFAAISSPDADYQATTNKIDISGLIEFNTYNSIDDGNLTVTFSNPVEKNTVPSSWATWSAPPITESSTPDVLFTGYDTLTLTLSKPCTTFGLELDPNANYITINTEARFYSGTELVGTLTNTVEGRPNTSFFAATTSTCTPFDRVEVSIDEPYSGFAIAQIRYAMTKPSECDCCCTPPVKASIAECNDSTTLPIEVSSIKCTGKLLNVDVTVTGCEKRRVVVGVFVCDPVTKKVLRFKACEDCMPASDGGTRCVKKTFNFCFVFQEDLCRDLNVEVKTIAEYACFNFQCNC